MTLSDARRSYWSLNAGGLDRGVGDDSAFDEQLAAAPATGLQPLFVSRSRSAFDAHDVRSLTSPRTSTNPTNFSASSANTGENVSVSMRLSASYA